MVLENSSWCYIFNFVVSLRYPQVKTKVKNGRKELEIKILDYHSKSFNEHIKITVIFGGG